MLLHLALFVRTNPLVYRRFDVYFYPYNNQEQKRLTSELSEHMYQS